MGDNAGPMRTRKHSKPQPHQFFQRDGQQRGARFFPQHRFHIDALIVKILMGAEKGGEKDV